MISSALQGLCRQFVALEASQSRLHILPQLPFLGRIGRDAVGVVPVLVADGDRDKVDQVGVDFPQVTEHGRACWWFAGSGRGIDRSLDVADKKGADGRIQGLGREDVVNPGVAIEIVTRADGAPWVRDAGRPQSQVEAVPPDALVGHDVMGDGQPSDDRAPADQQVIGHKAKTQDRQEDGDRPRAGVVQSGLEGFRGSGWGVLDLSLEQVGTHRECDHGQCVQGTKPVPAESERIEEACEHNQGHSEATHEGAAQRIADDELVGRQIRLR